jgi:hypothetical protein
MSDVSVVEGLIRTRHKCKFRNGQFDFLLC